MDFKDLFIVFIISLADMATTHMSMVMFNSCSFERNHLIISLCEVIGYGATWIWLLIEFTVITLVYEGLKKLRKILGARIKAEKIFLVLTIIPIINNVIFTTAVVLAR